MEIGFVVALIIAIPVILVPAALIWWINVGGIIKVIKARKARTATFGKKEKELIANVEVR